MTVASRVVMRSGWLLLLSISMMVVSVASGCAAPSIGSYGDGDRDLPNRSRGDDDDDDDSSGNDDDDDSTGSTNKNNTGSTTSPQTATKHSLTVSSTGDGTGDVTSEPAGVTCNGGSCTGQFAAGTKVTLTAAPKTGSIFAGWSGGGCTGSDKCETTLAAAATVTAQFITLAGTWTGTYSHSQQNSGCTFNNQGTLESTLSGTDTITSGAKAAGLEIKQLSGCTLVDTREGTAPASAATVSGNKVTGTWAFSIPGISGKLTLPYEATIIGKKMSGKWTCAGCTGSFDISKP